MYYGKFAMVMLSNGMPEMLCNVVHQLLALRATWRVAHSRCDPGDVENFQSLHSTVMNDIERLFCCIAHTAIR